LTGIRKNHTAEIKIYVLVPDQGLQVKKVNIRETSFTHISYEDLQPEYIHRRIPGISKWISKVL